MFNIVIKSEVVVLLGLEGAKLRLYKVAVQHFLTPRGRSLRTVSQATDFNCPTTPQIH